MNDTRNIVDRYYAAWEAGDFEGLRSALADNFEFEGPLQQSNGPDDYIAMTKKNASMFAGANYQVARKIVDGDHAVVLSTLTMGGTKVHTAEHFTLVEGKLAHLRLYFDPTPLSGVLGHGS